MNRQHSMRMSNALRYTTLAGALMSALAACGGGGGPGALIRPDVPSVPESPKPPVVETPDPRMSAHLTVTNTQVAHAAGIDGSGVRVGVVDTGVRRDHPALRNRVIANLNYIDPKKNDLSKDDVHGHGTAVSQIIAGTAFGSWPGGVAPGARIVSARIISDKEPEDDGSGEGNEVDGALGLAGVHDDLIQRGVKVMNNSWGGLYWSDLNATNKIAEEYRRFIIRNDGLVVFATGNEGKDQPSDMAALPSQPGPNGTTPAADLTRGWLAVTAVDPADVNKLDSLKKDGTIYPNACGAAMSYCLAAPGTVAVTDLDDAPDKPNYMSWSGTSLAAPQVSGAAALVWQKYPYFSNDQIRQTLLGTARDIGAAGPDPVFGYGLLDVGKAVDGPAKFDWGDFVANVPNGKSTWGNHITGSGGLVKQGAGELIIGPAAYTGADDDGIPSYSGPTRVEAGTLRLRNNANLLDSDITIAPGATLAGFGAVRSVVNNGTLLLDDKRLHAGYGYTQTANARLSVELPSPITMLAAAKLDGELNVIGVKPDYINAKSFDIIHASDIQGRFSKLTTASNVFLTGELEYRVNGVASASVILNVTRLQVTAAAQALGAVQPAAMSSAQRLETAFTQIDSQQSAPPVSGQAKVSGNFIAAAGKFQHIGDQQLAKAALNSLSGEAHSRAASATFDSIDMSRRALSSRFNGFNGRTDLTGSWSQNLGMGNGQSGYIGSDLSINGWMLGHDQKIGDNLIAGMAFGATRSDTRLAGNQDRGRDRQTNGQLYVGGLHGNSYTLAQVGFGRYDRDIDRRLFDGDGWGRAQSRYSGNYASLNLEAGHRFQLGGTSVTPYLGGEVTRLHSDGFNETGSGAFGLTGRSWSAERTQAIAGVRMRHDWNHWAVRGYGEWQQTLGSSGFDSLQASFNGMDAWSALPDMAPGRSGGLFGVGVDTWLAPRAQLSFGYDRRFGPRGNDHMTSLQFRAGF